MTTNMKFSAGDLWFLARLVCLMVWATLVFLWSRVFRWDASRFDAWVLRQEAVLEDLRREGEWRRDRPEKGKR
jgi:hypothetical protein